MTRCKRSGILPDLGILLLLLLLPLLLFTPVALGHKTLLPADSLFLFEPYRSAASEFGISYPHNHLLSDLILENYAWKSFLRDALRNRELPLWDPYIFAGHPFLANGQHSALYPLSIVFYILPLWRAFGVFAWLQLGLAGVFTYLFARVLGIRRLGGLIAGITFQLSGFIVVSAVHPMIIAGASWLPFILAMVELILQQRPALGGRPATLPWALLGALGLGCQMLAGHAENTYFVLLVTALYAAWRLVSQRVSEGANERESESANERVGEKEIVEWLRRWRRPVLWLAVMVTLGLALGAVQFIPLYEVASNSFRSGREAASLAQVRGWAYPWRRLIAFAVPNFFGNPAHHGYFDLFTWRWTPAPAHPDGRYIDWGIKNYVEGGAYLGLLPLFLAIIAIISWLKPYVSRLTFDSSRITFDASRLTQCATRNTQHAIRNTHYTIPFFTLLSLFSLGCIFGTPLYALVYALPGMRQSHSPFRWVFPLTLSVAVLAGFGVKVVQRSRKREAGSREQEAGSRKGVAGSEGARERADGSDYALRITHHVSRFISKIFFLDTAPSPISTLAGIAFWGGVVTLVGLALSRVFFAPIEPFVEQAFLSLAKAPGAFPDHRAFYSYEFRWIALFGLLLTGTGIVLRVSRCPIYLRKRPVWEFLAVGLLVLDLVAFGVGFHPAVDPTLLDYTPPVVDFLKQDDSLWRYATFTPSGTIKTMNANTGMFYELQCVAGYDSLFSRQYADYMDLIEEQDELKYNRIASFSEWSSLDSPLTDLLNVKYIITEVEIDSPKYELAYQDEAVRVYENLSAMPRAFTLPTSATMEVDDFAAAVQEYDPRRYVMLETENWKLDARSWKLDTGGWKLDTGFWKLDSGNWMLDTGYWKLDTGYWMLETGSWMLDAGSWILETGCWKLDAGCWKLDAGNWKLDAGCWILDSGNWMLDAGCWKPETGCWMLETGSWRLNTRNQHLALSIKHLASSIEQPASSIKQPASSIKHPASSIKHLASSNQHLASSNQHPASSIKQPVTSYSNNEVFVDATVSEPSWLVLADSYAPGWKAFVRPQGAGEEAEQEVEIHRVNGNFRGVLLKGPGAWTVRFKYSPDSVKIAAFTSFIAGMTLLFLSVIYLWRFFYREEDDASTVRRVAKNSLAPIVLNLFNRIIDFAFAALMARILGPVGNGRYFTAVAIYGWFDIIANFGLDMYLMREVTRDRARARRIFVNATVLRLLLFVAVIPALGGFLAGRQALGKPLTTETIWTIVLLYAGLLPGTIANSLTALFRACEKHEIPAAIQTVTTIVKVTLGTLALVGGLGIIGLAGASILTNLVTTVILAILAWRLIWPTLPRAMIELKWPLQRSMLNASWPLMASLLLQSIFTGANVVLLQYFRGDQAVGWYNAASKWVMNMLNIVPSLFTFAVFPIMSRQADEDRARLRRSYGLSLKLLTIIALPTAVAVTLLATPLVQILSGAQFLPHGAIALRLLVWSILFGWANSLTNYVLIALNRQRYVVTASGARVAFALTANLLLVGRFGYVASAWIIIGGELLLALLFQLDLRRHLGGVAWGQALGRPTLAGLAMGAAAWALAPLSRPLALVIGLGVYALGLILLRALTPQEVALLAPLVPAPLQPSWLSQKDTPVTHLLDR